MSTHDCPTCKRKGDCPLESISPWLNEHEAEVSEAWESCSKDVIGAVAAAALRNPAIMLDLDTLKMMAQVIFILGYAKRAQREDIPEAFKSIDKS